MDMYHDILAVVPSGSVSDAESAIILEQAADAQLPDEDSEQQLDTALAEVFEDKLNINDDEEQPSTSASGSDEKPSTSTTNVEEPAARSHTRQQLCEFVKNRKEQLLEKSFLVFRKMKKLENAKLSETVDDVRITFQVSTLFEGGVCVRVSLFSTINDSDEKQNPSYASSVFIDGFNLADGKNAMMSAVELLSDFIAGPKCDPVSDISKPFFVKRHIVPNEQRGGKRFENFSLYCRLCELHVKSPNLFLDHIRGTDHKLLDQRLKSRRHMLSYWQQLPPLSYGKLRHFIDNVEGNSAVKMEDFYKRFSFQAVERRFKALEKCVQGYTIRFLYFGSYVIFMGSPSSPIDLFVLITRDDGMEATLAEKIKVIQKIPLSRLKPYETCFSGWLGNLKLGDKTTHVFLTLDPRAWNAVLSSRLYSLYVQRCPPLVSLALMFRCWAFHMGFLQKKAEQWVSGVIFDYMVLHFMQQYHHLPIINSDLVEMPLEDFLLLTLEQQLAKITPHFKEHEANYRLPPTYILFMNLTLFYGCVYDYSTCVQITSRSLVYKEMKGFRHFRVLDPLSNQNLFNLSFENSLHLSNYLFYGCADILQPLNTHGRPEQVIIEYMSVNTREARNKENHNKTIRFNDELLLRLPFVVLALGSGKHSPTGSRRDLLNAPYLNGLGFWCPNKLKHPEPVCNACHKLRHSESNCPLLKVDEFPKGHVIPQLYDIFSDLFNTTYENERITEKYLENAMEFIRELEAKIIAKVGHQIVFEPFGSLVSGFGTLGSDYDLVVRLPSGSASNLTEQHGLELLQTIADTFEEDGFHVAKIFSAKVPIVTFRLNRGGQEFKGDISFSNQLALHNTKLLATYAKFDPRVAPLGIAIKRWANKAGINSAANHTLSSYALTVMTIHFLQQTKQPVLPYLQDADTFQLTEKIIVDGFEVQFAVPTDEFADGFRKNRKSLGQLFVKFFEYYGRFDWKNNVVQIRSPDNLLKMEKGWTQSFMAIEDPFELTHNLSGGVRPINGRFILKAIYSMNCQFRSENSVFLNHNIAMMKL